MIFSILRLKPFNFLRSPQSDHLSRSTILCTLLIFIGIWPGFLTPTGLGFSCWEGSFYLANSFSPWWIWFALHKSRSAFQDALALHYGWLPLPAPTHCACGTSFFVEHALSCPKGVLASIHHNEISDLTATLLTEVCPLNLNYSQFHRKTFLSLLPMYRIVSGWTSLWMDSGRKVRACICWCLCF